MITNFDLEQQIASLNHRVYHQIQDRNKARDELARLQEQVLVLEGRVSRTSLAVKQLNDELLTLNAELVNRQS